MGNQASLVGAEERQFDICPVCIADHCSTDLRDARPIVQMVKQKGGWMKANAFFKIMRKSKEERCQDIDVIQAPIDYERLEQSMETSAATLATDPTLVLPPKPEDLGEDDPTVIAWRETMSRMMRDGRRMGAEYNQRVRHEFRRSEVGKIAKFSIQQMKNVSGHLVAVQAAAFITTAAQSLVFKDYMKWACEKQADTLPEIERQTEYGRQLGEQLDVLVAHHAVANVPDVPREDIDQWRRAAQYNDVVIPDLGGIGMRFICLYTCMTNLGDGTKCCTAITSDAWDRKFADPMRPKQSWKCRICGGKYRTKFGVLNIWEEAGQSYMCRAEFPPAYIENMMETMAMTGMQSVGWRPPSSAGELLERIPVAHPCSKALIAVGGVPGHYKWDQEKMNQIPVMDWKQFYEMGRQAASGEWTPSPAMQQVPARLPSRKDLPLATIREVEDMTGAKEASVVEHNRLAIDYQPASTRPQAKKMPLPDGVRAFMRTLQSREIAEKILREGTHLGRLATAVELQGAAALVDVAMRAEAHITKMTTIPLKPDSTIPAESASPAAGAACSSSGRE